MAHLDMSGGEFSTHKIGGGCIKVHLSLFGVLIENLFMKICCHTHMRGLQQPGNVDFFIRFLS